MVSSLVCAIDCTKNGKKNENSIGVGDKGGFWVGLSIRKGFKGDIERYVMLAYLCL